MEYLKDIVDNTFLYLRSFYQQDATTLCKICRRLEPYAYLNGDDSFHTLTGYTLEHIETSSATCELCRLIYSKASLYPQVHRDGIEISANPGKALHLNKKGTGSALHTTYFPFCTKFTPSRDGQNAQDVKARCEGRVPHNDASSLTCLNLANEWLEECMKSHERCNTITGKGLPARILDVGGTPGSQYIRLIPTDGTQLKYIALSHTWGSSQPLTTTQATLQTRMKDIPLADLPATFQDAVRITRNLDCQYLWIDSLCIIQDSVEDWQRESSRMFNVYRYSLLTISALHSESSAAGILKQRLPKTSVEVVPEKSPGCGSIYVTAGLDYWNEILGRSVLNTRGWTLQERILSPRILHFSEDEILWECLTCVGREGSRVVTPKLSNSSYEEGYTGPILEVNMPPADMSQQKLLLGVINEWAGGGSKVPFLMWYKAVSYFSGRSLTFSKDKLPAISGLASEIHSLTGATYLAGLWREDLPVGLCWRLYPGYDAFSVRRASQYRAPSWSWASLDAKVEFFEPPIGEDIFSFLTGSYPSSDLVDRMNLSIIEAKVQQLGLDPFGEVISGSLILECVGLGVCIVPSRLSKNVLSDHKVVIGILEHMVPKGTWTFENDRVGFHGVIDAVDDLLLPGCMAIPLAIRTVEFDSVIALLVVPVIGHQSTFRRIGITWMSNEVANQLFARIESKGRIILI